MNLGFEDIQAIQSGLNLRGGGGLAYIPDICQPNGGGFVGLSQTARVCGIHRTTLVAAARGKKIKRSRMKDGRWEASLESLTRYLLQGYRYTRGGTSLGQRAGRWWGRWELLVLRLAVPHEEAARRLGRSVAAVKVKRCKLRRGT